MRSSLSRVPFYDPNIVRHPYKKDPKMDPNLESYPYLISYYTVLLPRPRPLSFPNLILGKPAAQNTCQCHFRSIIVSMVLAFYNSQFQKRRSPKLMPRLMVSSKFHNMMDVTCSIVINVVSVSIVFSLKCTFFQSFLKFGAH